MKFRAIFHKISIEISIKISIESSLPYCGESQRGIEVLVGVWALVKVWKDRWVQVVGCARLGVGTVGGVGVCVGESMVSSLASF